MSNLSTPGSCHEDLAIGAVLPADSMDVHPASYCGSIIVPKDTNDGGQQSRAYENSVLSAKSQSQSSRATHHSRNSSMVIRSFTIPLATTKLSWGRPVVADRLVIPPGLAITGAAIGKKISVPLNVLDSPRSPAPKRKKNNQPDATDDHLIESLTKGYDQCSLPCEEVENPIPVISLAGSVSPAALPSISASASLLPARTTSGRAAARKCAQRLSRMIDMAHEQEDGEDRTRTFSGSSRDATRQFEDEAYEDEDEGDGDDINNRDFRSVRKRRKMAPCMCKCTWVLTDGRTCPKTTTRESDMRRHVEETHQMALESCCPHCNARLSRPDALTRHMQQTARCIRIRLSKIRELEKVSPRKRSRR
jgi:hypothetical protein